MNNTLFGTERFAVRRGSGGRGRHRADGSEVRLAAVDGCEVAPGDQLIMETSGGGGYGLPDPEPEPGGEPG